MQRLPIDSTPEAYQAQAHTLLAAWRAGDSDAEKLVRSRHPHYFDDKVEWLPKSSDVAPLEPTAAAAELVTARHYGFAQWSDLIGWTAAVSTCGSNVNLFETAVDAVVEGDETKLNELLAAHPELVRQRSTRVHRATLLHYIAANGVEDYRQRTPPNAVAITKLLLDAGADPNATAGFYGSQTAATLGLLVSSCHPHQAGLQTVLAELLLDHGAEMKGVNPVSALTTALAYGYADTAEVLVRRGAQVDHLALAAGLGRLDDFERLLPDSTSLDCHSAVALAAVHGRTIVMERLLDAGEDPNRLNPKGFHGHSTPLHQAVCFGHEDTVRLLVTRAARIDIKDTVYGGTPLGWAEHCGREAIARYLRQTISQIR